jgi:lambda family phage minor tail protein L
MTISQDILKANADKLVQLFELDLNEIGVAQVYRFHAGENELLENVIWRGLTYLPRPIEASGFEFSGKGQIPRPTLLVADIDGAVTGLVNSYQDLVGAKFIRRRTHVKYLDAANFTDGANDTANPNERYADDIYFVERKVAHNKILIEFELSAAFDVHGVKLPSRRITQMCPWLYKGPECGYIPGLMFTITGQPTSDPLKDACSKHLDNGCSVRFGITNPLPFGGFPGVGLFR